jgi:hypothetical protein
VTSEADGAKYFAKELSSCPMGKKIVSAIKVIENGVIYLLTGLQKSLLVSKNKKCARCDSSDFDNLSQVQTHFEQVHRYVSTLTTEL